MHAKRSEPPRLIKPQLALLVERPPTGDAWAHELKLDGYRLNARITPKEVRLLTRNGLDWTHRYGAVADSLSSLKGSAYIDGEIAAVNPDGTTSFSALQAAMDQGTTDQLVYFAFDLLFRNGRDLTREPLSERKERLRELIDGFSPRVRYVEHVVGNGAAFLVAACQHHLEGIVSKPLVAPYKPGDRGLWVKTKCANIEEFVVVGFTDPDGSRPYFGSLLLGFYDTEGKLHYAGRGGTGMNQRELKRVYDKMKPLVTTKMPLAEPPQPPGASESRSS